MAAALHHYGDGVPRVQVRTPELSRQRDRRRELLWITFSRPGKLPMPSTQTSKYSSRAGMCTCSAHLIKHASGVTCVYRGQLGIPECILPTSTAATVSSTYFKVQTSLHVDALELQSSTARTDGRADGRGRVGGSRPRATVPPWWCSLAAGEATLTYS